MQWNCRSEIYYVESVGLSSSFVLVDRFWSKNNFWLDVRVLFYHQQLNAEFSSLPSLKYLLIIFQLWNTTKSLIDNFDEDKEIPHIMRQFKTWNTSFSSLQFNLFTNFYTPLPLCFELNRCKKLRFLGSYTKFVLSAFLPASLCHAFHTLLKYVQLSV